MTDFKRRRLLLLFALCAGSAEAGRLMGRGGGSPPPPAPAPAGQTLAEPLINWTSTTGGSGQFTLAWYAPIWKADYSTAADTITEYTGRYRVAGGDATAARLAVMNGPDGSGTTSASIAAGTLTWTPTGLAAGTYYVTVTASNSTGESLTSQSVALVVT